MVSFDIAANWTNMTQNEDSTVPSAGMSGEEKTVSLLRSNNIHLRLETPKGLRTFLSAALGSFVLFLPLIACLYDLIIELTLSR